jgi:DNA-binding response OmpR family regulator
MLQVNINRLRRKLESDPAHPRYILTEPGVGYVLATPPQV